MKFVQAHWQGAHQALVFQRKPRPKPRPKRRFGRKVQWIVTLGTDRLGDWIVVEIDRDATEADVLKTLTRTQRKKAYADNFRFNRAG